MTFSVIIPCHNAVRWIPAAIESVRRQTLQPLEIIVIDDASSDGSADLARSLGEDLRILHANVRNAGAARNIGIRAAVGRWIALLDADDIWYPTHLERARQMLDSSSDMAFMSNHDWIDLNGAVVDMPPEFVCSLRRPQSGLTMEDFFEIDDRGLHFGHSTVVYDREAVMSLGGFDESQLRRHDIDLWLRMTARYTWSYDTQKGAGYRESTPGSISKDEHACDYYYLRALCRNTPRVPGPHFNKHFAKHVRRALGRAMDADEEHRDRVWSLVSPRLSRAQRVIYSTAFAFPTIAGVLLRLKRRVACALRTRSPLPRCH